MSFYKHEVTDHLLSLHNKNEAVISFRMFLRGFAYTLLESYSL